MRTKSRLRLRPWCKEDDPLEKNAGYPKNGLLVDVGESLVPPVAAVTAALLDIPEESRFAAAGEATLIRSNRLGSSELSKTLSGARFPP